MPLRYCHAIRKFGLNHPILGTLESIPGIDLPNQKKLHAHLTLVDPYGSSRGYCARHCHGTIRIEHGCSRPLRRIIREAIAFHGNCSDTIILHRYPPNLSDLTEELLQSMYGWCFLDEIIDV